MNTVNQFNFIRIVIFITAVIIVIEIVMSIMRTGMVTILIKKMMVMTIKIMNQVIASIVATSLCEQPIYMTASIIITVYMSSLCMDVMMHVCLCGCPFVRLTIQLPCMTIE